PRPRPAGAQPSAVLAPLPRKSTGGPMNEGRDATVPGWDSNEVTVEATVRALPGVLSPLPVGADDMPTVAIEQTDSLVATNPGSGGGSGAAFFFKSLTILLVIAAAGFFAYYFTVGPGSGSQDLPYSLPKNAPVPGGGTGSVQGGAEVPLYAREISSNDRNVERARQLTREGDQALQRMDIGLATTKYREAFGVSGDAELALKLGDAYWNRPNPDMEEASGWWRRHLKEKPDSKARELIKQRMDGAVARPGTP
ncbi:serine/threonine protein kinase, partial [Pyxidicoccus sp. 3LFB2]